MCGAINYMLDRIAANSKQIDKVRQSAKRQRTVNTIALVAACACVVTLSNEIGKLRTQIEGLTKQEGE